MQGSKLHPFDGAEAGYEAVGLPNRINDDGLAIQLDPEGCP
jgi:hypothetical protein